MKRPSENAPPAHLLTEIHEHLVRAQELMDSVDPASIFGARIQQLIDDIEHQLDPAAFLDTRIRQFIDGMDDSFSNEPKLARI